MSGKAAQSPEPLYDIERHEWVGQCPHGDVCTGCDARGYCARMEAAGAANVRDHVEPEARQVIGDVDARERLGNIPAFDRQARLVARRYLALRRARRYEEIGDQRVVGGLCYAEGSSILKLIDEPTDDFKDLVVALDEDGCDFPLQQAGLMLRNTPGVAQAVLTDARQRWGTRS